MRLLPHRPIALAAVTSISAALGGAYAGPITFTSSSKGCGVNSPAAAAGSVALAPGGKLVLTPAKPAARLPAKSQSKSGEATDVEAPGVDEALFMGAGDMSAGSRSRMRKHPGKFTSK